MNTITALLDSQTNSTFIARKLLSTWKGEGKTEAPVELVHADTPALVGGGSKVHMTGVTFIRALEDFEVDGHPIAAGTTAQWTQTYTTCGASAVYGQGGRGVVRVMRDAEVTCTRCLKRLADA